MHRRVYASMWIFGDAIGLRIDSIKASLMRTLLFLSRIYRIWLVSRVCDDRLICQQANQTRASVFSRREKACIPLEPQIRSRRACTGTELKRGGGRERDASYRGRDDDWVDARETMNRARAYASLLRPAYANCSSLS